MLELKVAFKQVGCSYIKIPSRFFLVHSIRNHPPLFQKITSPNIKGGIKGPDLFTIAKGVWNHLVLDINLQCQASISQPDVARRRFGCGYHPCSRVLATFSAFLVTFSAWWLDPESSLNQRHPVDRFQGTNISHFEKRKHIFRGYYVSLRECKAYPKQSQ